MLDTATQETPASVSDDEAAKIAKLFDQWKAGRSRARAKRFRPVGLLTSGRFVFLHLERMKRGVAIPKLVAQAELHIVTFRDPANKSAISTAINSARSVAYEKLRT
jgi:hypothetical protein